MLVAIINGKHYFMRLVPGKKKLNGKCHISKHNTKLTEKSFNKVNANDLLL